MKFNNLKGVFLLLVICLSVKNLIAANDEELLPLILKNLPAENIDHAEKINRAIFDLGENAIKAICNRLDAANPTDMAQAEYALSGLTDYAAQKNNEKERDILIRIINEVLKTDRNSAAKQFLLNQLTLIGGDASVDVVGELITDKDLRDPALKALSAINTNKAKNVLLKTLDADNADKIKIIKTLGDMRFENAAGKIQNYLDSDDRRLVFTCVDALSRIGEPQSFALAMQKIAASEKDRFYLTYAQRRAELGDKQTCVDICRRVLSRACHQDSACHHQIAALHTLVSVAGREAVPDLFQAADSPHFQLQSSALTLLQNFTDDNVVEALISRIATAQGEGKALLAATLGKMENKNAVPAIEKLLYDNHETVRMAAQQALLALDEEKALQVLLSCVRDTLSKTEKAAVKEALLGLPLHEDQIALSRALQSAAPDNKIMLIEIIGERRFCTLKDTLLLLLQDENPPVRMAVIRSLNPCMTSEDIDPLLAYYQGRCTDGECIAIQRMLAHIIRSDGLQEEYSRRCIRQIEKDNGASSLRLLELIGRIGGETSLSYLQKQLTVNDTPTRDAAFQALVNWPDSTVITLLLELSQTEGTLKYQILALQAGIRLTRSARFSEQEKLLRYKKAMSLTLRPEEKVQLVSAVAELRTPEALHYLTELLRDGDIRFEAGLAILTMTTPRYRRDEVLTGQEVASAWLQSQLDSSLYQQIIAHLENQQESSRRSSPGRRIEKKDLFVGHLFNGKDLTGWQTIQPEEIESSWAVEKGILYTAGKGGNWLATVNEYENFNLSLEFRLPPGGNSGIFLRAPQSGDPAYTGMEIQLLDDYAGQYAELKSWQYTGSIYAVQAPAKRATKRAGEWQKIEITCEDSKVRVVLNDETIIDTDLIMHMDKVAKNPGLKRRRGYIGLQDHSSRVEFRNIWLTELE